MADRKFLRAKTGFMLPDGTIVQEGQAVPADDRVVKGREKLFEPLEDGIETMTRAPGETRLNVQRPNRTVMSAEPTSRRRGRKAKSKSTAQAEPIEPEDTDSEDAEVEATETESAESETGGSDDAPSS